MSRLNELAQAIHRNAVKHGFWSPEEDFGTIIALCHTELSEAMEEYRCGHANTWFGCRDPERAAENRGICTAGCERYDSGPCEFFDEKPEGVAVEMGDCIMRILDWAAQYHIDMDSIIAMKMAYNETRPYKHGKRV